MIISNSPTILVVDDNERVCKGFERLLFGRAIVQTARSARSAAAKMEHKQFDIVLTDYEMENENGIWLLEYVRHRYPKTKRLLFSGRTPPDLNGHISNGLVQKFFDKFSGFQSILDYLTIE